MDDRFLFRGRADGVWHHGSLHICKQTGRHHIIGDFDGEEDLMINLVQTQCIEVDPTTVGQCTGMKDKNGTLVFEGDAVRWISSDGEAIVDIVTWMGSGLCLRNLGYTVAGYAPLEVIGNVHDNPDLLEE